MKIVMRGVPIITGVSAASVDHRPLAVHRLPPKTLHIHGVSVICDRLSGLRLRGVVRLLLHLRRRIPAVVCDRNNGGILVGEEGHRRLTLSPIPMMMAVSVRPGLVNRVAPMVHRATTLISFGKTSSGVSKRRGKGAIPPRKRPCATL